MTVLKEEDKQEVRKAFSAMTSPVKLVFFTQTLECQFCSVTRDLLTDVASLSDKISLEVYNFVTDEAKVRQYNIDKIPAIVIEGEKDYGIRFFGVPAGYEFTSLIDAIIHAGRREHGLPKPVTDELAKLTGPVHMQVMVSPTCPYCPQAVMTANAFAIASGRIRADMVEISEFPHLAVRYGVQGVPAIIMNDSTMIAGAQPALELARKAVEVAARTMAQ